MNDDLYGLGCIIVGSMFLLACLLAVGAALDSMACPKKFPDIETRWSLMGGCQVHSNEGWVPAENYRVPA